MAVEIVMTRMDMGQQSGTVVCWLKEEGEPVRKGEPVVEVETDKVVVEIEAPAAGILSGISAQANEEVPVGQVIAYILEPGDDPHAFKGRKPQPAPQPTPPEEPAPPPPAGPSATALPQPPARDPGGVGFGARLPAASPLARTLAAEGGLAIEALHGTGPEGAVIACDVRRAGETQGSATEQEGARRVPLTATRLTIARRMEQSAREIPHVSFTVSVDMASALNLCAEASALDTGREGGGLGLTALIAATTAAALRRHPRLNAHFLGKEILEFAAVNLGVAVALGDGLVVPVLRDAQAKRLSQMQRELSALTEKARQGKLLTEDVTGATFTLSNLGMYGTETFTALINPPQMGLLAVGAVTETPVAHQGKVTIRPVLRATLFADHRGVDGAACAEFLRELKALLEQPLLLLA